MIALPDDLLDELVGAAMARFLQPFKQALANLQKVLAAAFPPLSTLRFPRAHHPLASKGAGPKPRVGPLNGGSEISAEVCQRLGVPRPKRPWAAPPAAR